MVKRGLLKIFEKKQEVNHLFELVIMADRN